MTGENGKTYSPLPWLLGALTVALLAMVGAWAMATHNDIEILKAQQATVATDHEILVRLDSRVERMDAKLDGLFKARR